MERQVHFLSDLSLIDDEERRRVETIRRLLLQHRLQAAELIQNRLEEILPQPFPIVQELEEGLPEAFDGQAATVVLVPAEVVAGVQLVDLQRDARELGLGGSRHPRACSVWAKVTCMPHTLTPRVAEVLCAHFFICLAAFSSEASSPCCLVPIFRSRMQG